MVRPQNGTAVLKGVNRYLPTGGVKGPKQAPAEYWSGVGDIADTLHPNHVPGTSSRVVHGSENTSRTR